MRGFRCRRPLWSGSSWVTEKHLWLEFPIHKLGMSQSFHQTWDQVSEVEPYRWGECKQSPSSLLSSLVLLQSSRYELSVKHLWKFQSWAQWPSSLFLVLEALHLLYFLGTPVEGGYDLGIDSKSHSQPGNLILYKFYLHIWLVFL